MKIRKLLVANRGEIAVRIFKTCQELGIATVAVYSDADKESVHVRMADEAIHLGASEAVHSYLSIAKIIDAARRTGADAIHPGYGFLSERHEFSRICRENGICFVGPSPESMIRLGDKISAKELAVASGVPIVPGYFSPGASLSDLREAATRVGYPVMLKASAGGGGRGMRAVWSETELEPSLELARVEAENAFGNGEMMLEKLIQEPRHVEVQVVADLHGRAICLFERECSMQRRNQKMLEEAPAPAVESGLVDWLNLREAALKIIVAAGYTNAGTVEFIVDRSTGAFYFMEVNARLQVEHPVTEMITGIDLVALQIRIAEGKSIALGEAIMKGERNGIVGHAIEVRILAENPSQNFMPSVGKIVAWAVPKRLGVRIDTGFETGKEVSSYYDSLIAKVIAHGEDRPAAIRKLVLALEEFHVLGIRTNVGFLLDIMKTREFLKGEIHTGFLESFSRNWSDPAIPEELLILAKSKSRLKAKQEPGAKKVASAWGLRDRFRN